MREELLDKLELVLTTLEASGVSTRNVVVLSGFRTPQHNLRASFEGAAYASRHQYGDAADIIIDSDGNGRMDDLNRDGDVNFMDTDVINRAVERVEQQYPELVGGLGLYRAIGPSGPFAHIDVRGTRARWTNTRKGRSLAVNSSAGDVRRVVPTGTCKAPPEFAYLCKRSRPLDVRCRMSEVGCRVSMSENCGAITADPVGSSAVHLTSDNRPPTSDSDILLVAFPAGRTFGAMLSRRTFVSWLSGLGAAIGAGLRPRHALATTRRRARFASKPPRLMPRP
jgi:hypothetical protein